MSNKKQKKSYALEVTLVFFAIGVAFVLQGIIRSANPPEIPEIESGGKTALEDGEETNDSLAKIDTKEYKDTLVYNPDLTDLAEAPDWTELNAYQYTISKEDFERELEEVYTINGAWRQWVTMGEDFAMIRTSATDEEQQYKLFFTSELRQEKLTKFWKARDEIIVKDLTKPLLGLKIVIDPGHIGGEFAEIEEREFFHKDMPPVKEGDLTLNVANQLAKQLETLGADVTLTREYLKPVNRHQPEEYYAYASNKLSASGAIMTPKTVQRNAEKLFYRAGEIRERAILINEEFRPDLVLCLHFNAGHASEELIQEEHFHLILNGAYMDKEVAKDDQRFIMMKRILQRIHDEEVNLTTYAASAFSSNTGLKPYLYNPDSNRALNVDKNPYLWARNLAANRSYLCPVIFYEPYLMNGADSHARLMQGDYEGLRYLNGMLRPSIFREYVDSVTEGLVNYYSNRK